MDKQAGYRPVENIAALSAQGIAPEVVRAPKFLMLRPAATNPLNDAVDFRDELNLTKAKVAAWQWEIWVSDQVSQPSDEGWQKIGQITAVITVLRCWACAGWYSKAMVQQMLWPLKMRYKEHTMRHAIT